MSSSTTLHHCNCTTASLHLCVSAFLHHSLHYVTAPLPPLHQPASIKATSYRKISASTPINPIDWHHYCVINTSRRQSFSLMPQCPSPLSTCQFSHQIVQTPSPLICLSSPFHYSFAYPIYPSSPIPPSLSLPDRASRTQPDRDLS